MKASRRHVLKSIFFSGCLLSLKPKWLFSSVTDSTLGGAVMPTIDYRYKTISVSHLESMQQFIDDLIGQEAISRHKTFRSYIDKMQFKLPDDFPQAKFMIVLARFSQARQVVFHYRGHQFPIMIPPQYTDDGVTTEQIMDLIQHDIIPEKGYQLKRARGIFLKHLAVRSGLGQYGRNNICYVDGMGSYIHLSAYFTDFEFMEDSFQDLKMMEMCRDCRICRQGCPTGCIMEERVPIDAGRCLTLYNEVAGEFPDWIALQSHNALVGCMKCQDLCPANRHVANKSSRLEDITEEETQKILEGYAEKEFMAGLSRKLGGFYLAEDQEGMGVFRRNLKVLLPD